MRHWEMLYERQSVRWDAILLAAALAIHTPLMLLHMKAPVKGKKGVSRLVNIDYIEQQIQERKEKPVALPPKIPEAPKQLQDMVKKMEEVQKQVFKRSLPPPPPPKAKLQEDIIKGPEPTKLQDKLSKDLEQKKVLQGKGSFQEKDLTGGPNAAAKELKLAGGAAASIQAGSRLSSAGLPSGGALKGKSGFSMAESAAPTSIGGDDGGLKIGGGENIVVVPTGARARADSSILNPVAARKDKGSLASSGPGLTAAGPASSGPSLAGAGAAAPIAIGGGNSRLPAAGTPAPKREDKRLEEKSMPNPLAEAAKPAPSGPAINMLPRRVAPKVQKPLFQISGPLQNRTVVSRSMPEYPEWAREKGVESAVLLQFTVTPEGDVKDNILVLRTSGYPAMDDLAIGALRRWKFAVLPADQYREEVGTITFNFSVR